MIFSEPRALEIDPREGQDSRAAARGDMVDYEKARRGERDGDVGLRTSESSKCRTREQALSQERDDCQELDDSKMTGRGRSEDVGTSLRS